MPWTLLAAKREGKDGKYLSAGGMWSLSVYYKKRAEHYQRVIESWRRVGDLERAGRMKFALGQKREAAKLFMDAGNEYRLKNEKLAVQFLKEAFDIYRLFLLRKGKHSRCAPEC